WTQRTTTASGQGLRWTEYATAWMVAKHGAASRKGCRSPTSTTSLLARPILKRWRSGLTMSSSAVRITVRTAEELMVSPDLHRFRIGRANNDVVDVGDRQPFRDAAPCFATIQAVAYSVHLNPCPDAVVVRWVH